MLGPLW